MSILALPDPVELLFVSQDSVARLDQLLTVGLTRTDIADQLTWGKWQAIGNTVIIAHNGPLTPNQQEWAAVLGAGSRAVLCGRSAAARSGLEGWDDEGVHVLVERGTTPPPLPLPIVVHESRRYTPATDAHPTRCPPMTRVDRSLVDAAAWTRHPRSACGLLIAGVQQRLTRPDRLLVELVAAGQVRHRRVLQAVMTDVEGGAQALSEVDFARLCRRHGLPAPLRQSVRVDSHGRRRYVDVEMLTRSGRTLAVEIDGAAHLIVGSYWNDMSRANEIVIAGQPLLRFPTVALYLDEAAVISQLRRALDS